MKTKDFIYSDTGSIIWLTPKTRKAVKWIERNLIQESFVNPDNVPIDPRYFDEVYEAIQRNDLLISI